MALAGSAVAARPPMLRQYRELAHDLWKFTIAGRIEGKLYIAITAFFGIHHMTVIGRVLRVIFFERIERENHILWRYRRAVMPFRLRPQTIDDVRKILGMTDLFGQRAVFGRNLIQRGRHQSFVDEPDSGGDGAFDA